MAYCTVAELRDEGVSDPPTDAALERRIALGTALIDKWTGRWFEPRTLTILADGTGAAALLLGQPIISISSVRLSASDTIDLEQVRIYNRHLSGFLDPDDRENPRIEWLALDHGSWPRGRHNLEIEGIFGYTDPDVGGVAAATGVTPPLIKHACMLMVLRNLAPLADTDAREESLRAGRVTSLRTRDQSISYAGPGAAGGSTRLLGAFSGDPEIDSIIAAYCRPPALGAV